MNKQLFANSTAQSIAMRKKTIHQLLAEGLRHLMERDSLSNNALGQKAGVAANTIANYLGSEEVTSKGKPRSASLAQVELLAHALNVDPLDLLAGGQHTLPPDRTLSREVLVALSKLSPDEVRRHENGLRGHLGLPLLDTEDFQETTLPESGAQRSSRGQEASRAQSSNGNRRVA